MSARFMVYTSEDVINGEDSLMYGYDELPDALARFFDAVVKGDFARLDFSA